MSNPPTESTISPAEREKLQKLFAEGNKQMMKSGFQYADDIYLTPCVLGDPANILYFKTFLANLKKKFGEKKKKGFFGSVASSSKKAVASKKPEEKFKAAIAAIRANPWDVRAFLDGGDACSEMGYAEVALEYYRAACDAEPMDADANWACAHALRDIADYDGAITCMNRYIKTRPQDKDALRFRGNLDVEKTIHKSKVATGDGSQLRDAAAQARGGIAEDEDVMGRKLTYIEQVERQIKKNPEDISNYLTLAQYYYQQSDYDKAEEYLVKCVEKSKQAPDMQERLLDAQKQKLLAKVLKLKEEFETTRNKELVQPFNETKAEYEEKNLELVKHRIKHHPSHSGYRFEYGMLLRKQKLFREAIAEFQIAQQDVTKKGECLLAIGQCFQQIQQHTLAMKHYQEAVKAITENGDEKKKALYLTAKLAFDMKDYETSKKYGEELAMLDFAYKDLGDLLDKVSQKLLGGE
ncbi:MAG: tetratricopeptide repeat protein [Planctomycetaceae bacterium]|nr:tetratricopeptide repeat protein [Planctomycetaceae bacterium]